MDTISTAPASAEKTARKPRGRPFVRGNSANPNGRPKGARNAATVAAETLLDGEAAALTRKAVELALEGDMAALRLCLERVLPPRRDRPVVFQMPALATAADALTASVALVEAVSSGEVTPAEAGEIGSLIHAHVKLFEVAELERRIVALEQSRP
jgi:hypothetical protein